MATLSNAGTAGTLPASISGTGITGGGSDGTVTWSVGGQSGSTVYLQASGAIGSVSLSGNTVTANMSKSGSGTYVTVQTSDPANFTINVQSAGSGSTIKFRKGTGGGH
ncbi:MAG: hypothetical protein IPI55_05785 [Flavobacteriales bacterium]|nr:hypothetical protein [Flavobacteriales bacterium]